MGAIYVMWLRQLKKYWRSKPRMIASLGQPLLFLLAMGFGLSSIYAKGGGGNYVSFLVPGIVSMAILFTSMFTGIEIIWDRQFGFLKETLVAPVPRWEIMFGRILGGATVATFQGLIIFAVTFLVGFRPFNLLYLPIAFVFMFLIALLFTAFVTVVASRMEDMQAFPILMNFFIMPIFFLSGALFPLDDVPDALRVVSSLNPLSYGVDGLRGSLIGTAHFGLGFDVLVLSAVTGSCLILGSYLFSKIQI